MPPASRYEPPDSNGGWSETAKPVEEAFIHELRLRQARHQDNTKYYESDMKKPLHDDGSGVNDNVIIPLVENLIDSSVTSMTGTDVMGIIEGVRFEIPKTQPQGLLHRAKIVVSSGQVSEDQTFLDDLMKKNQKNVFLHELFLNSSLTGHVFIKIIPGENGDPPRWVLLNSSNVSFFWDEMDADKILWYRIQVGNEGKRRRQDIVREDEGWAIYEYSESPTGYWKLDKKVVWTYPFAPIVDWKNQPRPKTSNNPYGKDDLSVLGQINDAINFNISNQGRIEKNHAHPLTVAVGAELGSEKDIDDDGEEIDMPLKNTVGLIVDGLPMGSEVYNVEMKADLTAYQNRYGRLRREFYEGGREVDHNAILDNPSDITNFRLRVIYARSMEKRQIKWVLAEAGLRDLVMRSFVVAGRTPNPRLQIIPPDPLPSDPIEQTTALVNDVQVLGLSKETALQKRGYDPHAEAIQRKKDEAEAVQKQQRLQKQMAVTSMRKVEGEQQSKPPGT